MLAYPDYSEPFEIFMDASTRQLGAVITQKGRPLAFFSRKLSAAQEKYTVTELELLLLSVSKNSQACYRVRKLKSSQIIRI